MSRLNQRKYSPHRRKRPKSGSFFFEKLCDAIQNRSDNRSDLSGGLSLHWSQFAQSGFSSWQPSLLVRKSTNRSKGARFHSDAMIVKTSAFWIIFDDSGVD